MAAVPDTQLVKDEREGLVTFWKTRPLPDLIEHILQRYHRTLERDLELLRELATESRTRHAFGDPQAVTEVAATLEALTEELLEHMAKEERILFPWILHGNGRTAGAPIAVMQQDHRRAEAMLESLAALTQGFRPPPGACTSWCRLVLKLQEVVRDLEDHMTLEDQVLFPRAPSAS